MIPSFSKVSTVLYRGKGQGAGGRYLYVRYVPVNENGLKLYMSISAIPAEMLESLIHEQVLMHWENTH